MAKRSSEEPSNQYEWESYLGNKLNSFKFYYNQKGSHQLCIQDFLLLRTIGTGSFGRVVLATMKSNYQHYAIKILEKEKIVLNHYVGHILSEKKVLQSISFPFVINMKYFFHDNSYLYFVLPFVQGGEVFTLLRQIYNLTEEEARFYSSQVVLALEYLHYLGIVYRDLKPENLLLDKRGYIKVTDFGFAKYLGESERTYTLCGTPEYMSPEILFQVGYGKSVDWWEFGVLIYEFCAGKSPFQSSDLPSLYEKITQGLYSFPLHFSLELQDLINNLLQKDVTMRLGNLKKGVLDIKGHPWFKTIDWVAILSQKIEAPFIPKLLSPLDDSQYDEYSNHQLIISSKNKYESEFLDF